MTKFTLHKPQRRRRQRGMYSVETKAQQIRIDTDEGKLGRPIVEAIRDLIAQGIRQISEQRQDGGRFANVTGYLSRGLRVIERAGEFVVSAPPGRLESSHWTQAGLAAFREKLMELVPALARPGTMFSTARMRAAVTKSIDEMIDVDRRMR